MPLWLWPCCFIEASVTVGYQDHPWRDSKKSRFMVYLILASYSTIIQSVNDYTTNKNAPPWYRLLFSRNASSQNLWFSCPRWGGKRQSSRLATTHESGIQAASTNRMLLADPRNESLKSQSVSAVRWCAVPRIFVSNGVMGKTSGNLLPLFSVPVVFLWRDTLTFVRFHELLVPFHSHRTTHNFTNTRH